MKKSIVILSVLFASCNSDGQKELPELKYETAGAARYHNGYAVAVIVYDSCEYLVNGVGYSQMISHKGNCKYCEQRRIADIPRVVEPIERYFLVSYVTNFKGATLSESYIEGYVSFSADGFPRKEGIDSMVYADLVRRKSCYEGIVIKSIFEFKNQRDYLSFSYKAKSNVKPVKKHIDCDNKRDRHISFPSTFTIDTTSTIYAN